MRISKKTFESLEVEKIREMLASCCVTARGKTLSLGLEPESSIEKVRYELELVAEIVDSGTKEDRLKVCFSEDISEILSKVRIGNYILEPADFLDIKTTIYSSKGILVFCRKYKDYYQKLWEEFEDIPDLQHLYDEINRIIDDDGVVSDNASPELRKIRSKIKAARNRVSKKLDSIVRSSADSDILTENIVTLRNDRYVVPVKSEKRSMLPGIIHEKSSSGASIYVEPAEVVELNNEVVTLIDDENRETKKILSELSSKCHDHGYELETSWERIVRADILCAKTTLAEEMEGIMPEVVEDGYYLIEGARHPLLDPNLAYRREHAGIESGRKKAEQVVPIDIDFSDGVKCLVITGPNTGGKTAAMKTTGLFTVMAHMGLFLPAKKAIIPFLKAVYADIGDIQSLINDLSTFSGHMRNISEIISDFDEPSLVLLDEVGSGTDPEEGTALALAIVEYFLEKNTLLLISTHKSQLKVLAYDHQKVDNATVDFDRKTLKPTYRLIRGMPGRSNALHVAEKEGLPSSILDRSLEYLKGKTLDMDKAIVGMEAERERMERARSGFENEKMLLIRQEEELKKQKEELKEEKKSALRECYQEVKNSLGEIRQLMKKSLAQVGNTKEAEKVFNGVRKKHLELLANIAEEANALDDDKKNQKLTVGATVTIDGMDMKATVLKITENTVDIEAGNVIMNVPANRLRLISSKLENAGKGAVIYGFDKKDLPSEFDVRGQILEDALNNIDKYIDDAVIAGLKQFRIVHGKGTGVLRKGISNMLRFDNRVESARLGGQGEGGSGVTVVKLS